MITPEPAGSYDPAWMRILLNILNLADNLNRKKLQDVELGQAERLILRSPNGSRWSITVSNTGVVSGTPL